ncbi:winged helix-turn-helix domain-containing protein [Yokenella regensburgei]|uniref:winged helix-turn-helix domain-containing protein n=1 Tax=Yokenella regensburgei TaxID=158877 RepID=UPI003ED8C4CF
MLWIINDNIEFNPERNRLASLSRPDLNVILTTPASRCLRLLLENAPSVVAQQTFFQKVWEEDGMVVPANTLYQNISIIRRGLRTVGETEDTLITTVPRKGFQIEPGVNVITISKASVRVEEKKAAEPGRPRLPWLKRYAPLLWMTGSLFIGIALGNMAWQTVVDKNFYDQYTLVETTHGCHFFSKNEDIESVNRFEIYKTMILKTGMDCQKYPWVYFPSSSRTPAVAALICQQPYKTRGDTGCVTLFFRGAAHE